MDDKQNYSFINLGSTDVSPAFPVVKNNRAGWVNFGVKNDYPQTIIDLNSKSPVNKAIVESTVTYICGKGVKDSNLDAKGIAGRPNPTDTWDDVIERIAKDYKLFGGFYWQVILNKDSKTVSIYHQDFSTVRAGNISKTGNPETFKIAADWNKVGGKNKPIELDAWPGIDEAKPETAYLFHYWDYEPGLPIYSVPGWHASTEYVKADGILAVFYNNSINNGFTPSVVINMPSNPDEDKKAAFQKQMENAFGGAKGASSIVILWGESDEVKPGITPFNASANADIYNNIEAIIFQKIISAHRLASPTLAGVSGGGNLSGNAAEIIDAYVLYNYTVIEKLRNKILEKLNLFTAINKTRKLVIDELDVLPKIRESEDPASVIDVSTGNGEKEKPLASEIGVGGTQAMTTIIESPNLDEVTKRGLLKTLFGLSDDDINALFGKSPATLQRKKNPLIKALGKIWN